MSATAVPASACLSATPICSSVNPFLGILRTSFPGASLPEKLRWDWIRIGGQDQSWLLDLSILLESSMISRAWTRVRKLLNQQGETAACQCPTGETGATKVANPASQTKERTRTRSLFTGQLLPQRREFIEPGLPRE